MRVLLISPHLTFHHSEYSVPLKSQLLGLRSIAAVLQRAGHEVDIHDYFTTADHFYPINDQFIRFGLTDQEILAQIRNFSPDVIGISSMFNSHAHDAHHVAKLAKQCRPNCLLIFGGAHPSEHWKWAMKDANIDICVIGEGERTIAELIDRAAKQQNFQGLKGIVHRVDGKVVQEEKRPLIDNLDDLPFPDRTLAPQALADKNNETQKNKFIMRPPVGFIQTSRGCPRKCYYCTYVNVFSRKWRPRSAQHVVDEIQMLHEQHGYDEIHFIDDNPNISKKRMMAIAEEIIARQLNIRLVAATGLEIHSMDTEVLQKMKQAGFYRLHFGIESGDSQSQRRIGKALSLNKARQVIQEANRLGFWTAGTFIFGHPHETMQEIRKTIDFAKKSGLDYPIFNILIPELGTKSYDMAIKDDLIDLKPSYLDPDSKEWYKIGLAYYHGCKTTFCSNKELQKIRVKAYRNFFLYKLVTPQSYINVLRKIKSREDLRYLIRICLSPIKMLIGSFFTKGEQIKSIPTTGARKASPQH